MGILWVLGVLDVLGAPGVLRARTYWVPVQD